MHRLIWLEQVLDLRIALHERRISETEHEATNQFDRNEQGHTDSREEGKAALPARTAIRRVF
jgi:hypothetical protein